MPPTVYGSHHTPMVLWVAVGFLSAATVTLGVAFCALVRPSHDLSWLLLTVGLVLGVIGVVMSVTNRMFANVS